MKRLNFIIRTFHGIQDSEDSWSDGSPKRKPKSRARKATGKAKNNTSASFYRIARKPGQKTVDYKEKDTDEDVRDEIVPEAGVA